MNGIGITLVTLLPSAAPALAQNEYDKGQGTARWEDTGEILYVPDEYATEKKITTGCFMMH